MTIQSRLNATFTLLIVFALLLAGQSLRLGDQLGQAIEQSWRLSSRRILLEQIRTRFAVPGPAAADTLPEAGAVRLTLRTLLNDPVDPREPAAVEGLLRDLDALETDAVGPEISEHLLALQRVYESAVQRAFGRLQNSTRWTAFLVFSLLFVALAQLLVISIGVRRWLVTPLGHVAEAMQRISRGNLVHRLPEKGHDEMSELARNINRMSASLAGYQQRLIETERLALLGEMSSYVAHAVRNPLASIRSAAQVGMEVIDHPADLRQTFADIIATADRLAAWAQELLTSIGPLRLKPGSFSVSTWLMRVRAMLEPAATAKGMSIEIAIEPGTPDIIEGDESLLAQALAAVLENAIEASPAPAPIQIVACPAALESRSDPAGIWVEVIDRGPGIPAELRQRVLLPYFTTKPRGTGIGLAMARHILLLHGGTVEVLDPPAPPGCRIRLAVPERLPPPESDPPVPAAGAYPRRAPTQ